jgi:hypothetical protein
MADDSVLLFNPNDGLTGRDGGPYLDEEEARIAEERRARVEKREPDYDTITATAGIPLTTAAQMIHNINVASLPSKGGVNWVNEAQGMFDRAVNDDENALQPLDEIDKGLVDSMVKDDAKHETEASDFNENDPNAPADIVDGTPAHAEPGTSGSTLSFEADDDLNLDDSIEEKQAKSEKDPKNTTSNTSPKSTSSASKTTKSTSK